MAAFKAGWILDTNWRMSFPIPVIKHRGTIMRFLFTALFLLSTYTNVIAQEDWSGFAVPIEPEVGTPTPDPTSFSFDGISTFTPRPTLDGNEFVIAGCLEQLPSFNCVDGTFQGVGRVPISAFARSDTVALISAEVVGLREEIDRGIALASAMEIISPAPGSSFRAGLNLGTSDDEYAVGGSFAYRRNKFDAGIAFAVSDGKGAGKASVGISW